MQLDSYFVSLLIDGLFITTVLLQFINAFYDI